ncbi:lipocalin-like domain-containing protein [Streptomyces sp. NPDC058469]|uniref:lipocalin-like domain-containing protein n=1 Tax=Streptomyces sp. NPDC058469 TaxID=3346514 RepID=UPI00365E6541
MHIDVAGYLDEIHRKGYVSMQIGADGRSLQERLVGYWRLTSYEVRDGLGVLVGHPLGDDAAGCLRYTADGLMSVQIMRLDRPRYQAGGLGDGTDAESAAAARGYVAYAGSYHVDGDSMVVHEPEVSLFPNWVHASMARKVVLVEPRLELITPEPLPFAGRQLTAVLRWQRVVQPGSTT